MITDTNEDVLTSLNMCQSSNVLNMDSIFIQGKLSKALFHSLQRQNSLREINLSGCSLFDDDIKVIKLRLSYPNPLII